jgi:hypothetical protein
MGIPKTLLNDLERIPADRPVALLIRHAARFPIPDPARSLEILLTEEGVRDAEELGAIVGKSMPVGKGLPAGRLLAPPVDRCLSTANAIARGAGWQKQAQPDDRLSHAYIVPVWEKVASGDTSKKVPLQVRIILDLLLESPLGRPRLDVMATHDSVVAVMANILLRAPVLAENWPGFLEGLFAWRDSGEAVLLWRGEERRIPLVSGHALEV